MAPTQILYVLLQLCLLCNAQYSLILFPPNPVVSLGGSVALNCSINCPGGKTTWKGLDTNLGGLYTAPGYSVLHISNATISMDGVYICVGNCPGKRNTLQGSLNLQVYALPETLLITAHPNEAPRVLRCSMQEVYPPAPISMSWYRGSDKLEVPDNCEEELQGDEGGFITHTCSLEIPHEEGLVPGIIYRCEAELITEDQVFKRVGTFQLPETGGSNEYFTNSVMTPKAEFLTSKEIPNIMINTTVSEEGPKATYTMEQSPTLDSNVVPVTLSVINSNSTNQSGAITFTEEKSARQAVSEGSTPLPTEDLMTNPNVSLKQGSILLPIIKKGTTPSVFLSKEHPTLAIPHGGSTQNKSDSREHSALPYTLQGTTSYVSARKDPTSLPTTNQEATSDIAIKKVSTLFFPTYKGHSPNVITTEGPTTQLAILIKSLVPSAKAKPTFIPRITLALVGTLISLMSFSGCFLHLWRRLRQKGSFQLENP
ncbi:mucosal addressin cell adhesion molecule 1 [Bombina bombina]|uniref:mucosal addressin cell adhesion molecule 1 n=1 Tax=Bombina bombina TaxID=8345 RepID=UPI00235B056D|nr:mucosal addressin cell adhesion molecule 1 [Bombina bombina]